MQLQGGEYLLEFSGVPKNGGIDLVMTLRNRSGDHEQRLEYTDTSPLNGAWFGMLGFVNASCARVEFKEFSVERR